MTDSEFAMGLMSLGYRDYIASRFLINNNYISQGTVLASSAVEKYLKAVLAINGIKCKYHLDHIGQFKSLFSQTPYHTIFEVLDPVFLEVLSKAYKYRYYDENTVTKPDTVGFLVNQFLGSMDFTIFKLDSLLIITKETHEGEASTQDSQLKRAAKIGLSDLWLNNYVLNKIDKKEFMDRKSQAFGLHISPLHFGEEFEISGTDVIGEYDGRIWTVTLKMAVPP